MMLAGSYTVVLECPGLRRVLAQIAKNCKRQSVLVRQTFSSRWLITSYERPRLAEDATACDKGLFRSGAYGGIYAARVLNLPPARLEPSAMDLLGHDHGAGPVWPDSHDVRVGAKGSARIDDPLTIRRPGGEDVVEVVVGNPHQTRTIWIRCPDTAATALTNATVVREDDPRPIW